MNNFNSNELVGRKTLRMSSCTKKLIVLDNQKITFRLRYPQSLIDLEYFVLIKKDVPFNIVSKFECFKGKFAK